ncbi:MAG: phage terminase large subunit [Alphaproteobacteria bacterium]|nr:phage terminase large subunit [Alphaproteobacteria bacterium]
MPPPRGKFAITDADFKLFLSLWNQRQGQSTPDIHFRIANWLEHAWISGDKNLLLMAFRSSGKSTLVGLFAAWILYRNSDLRILVLAADVALAKKMVRTVKRLIERHPLTAHMKPDKPDQWASDRFSVKRMMERRDPSMMAAGVTSNITGSRADIIICDDVEVPNTCDTAEKREALRERLAELSYVGEDQSALQLYVGTPHSYYTIYARGPRVEVGEDKAFLHGYKRLEIPLLDERGESIWPERFGAAMIEQMKRQSGPNKFNSQMMLRPVNIAQGRLDPALLRIYDHELDYTKELNMLFLGQTKLVCASAWWDPAFGAASGDRSVLAIVYSDEEGRCYLHSVNYIKISGADETDEATQQCREIVRLAKQHYLPSLTVEINGIGKFLPSILRNEMARTHVPCRVQEVANTRPKDIRILEAFDAVMAARRLYIHRAVSRGAFMTEMQEWRPGTSRGHDDGLDAVAGALSLQPVRLKRIYGAGGHSWMGAAQNHKAKTDFKI